MGIRPIATPLEAEECLGLLRSTSFGRVALTIGALPVIRTVRFALTPGRVVFRVASDRAVREATAGVIAFHVDHQDLETGQSWQVHVQGRAEELRDPLIVAQLEALPPEAWTPAAPSDPFFSVPLTVVTGERVRWSPSPP